MQGVSVGDRQVLQIYWLHGALSPLIFYLFGAGGWVSISTINTISWVRGCHTIINVWNCEFVVVLILTSDSV